MRTLSATLQTAQEELGLVLTKVVFTKTGQTTRTYDNTSTSNELLSVLNKEYVDFHTAEVIVDNYNDALSSLDLRGYKAVISNGYQTSAGSEYSPKPPLYVIDQREETREEERDIVIFSLASKTNQLRADRAKLDYLPDSSNTDTVETIVGRIFAGTISGIGTVDFLGAVKTQAAIGAASLAVKNLGTGTINKDTTFTIANDTTVYKVSANATIASNEATISFAPTLVAQADVDEVVTLISPFGHTEAFSLSGSIDADIDPVISSFKPADFFRILYGQTRKELLDGLLRYTFTVYRWRDDEAFYYYHYKNGHAKAWTANTVIRKGETRKPTTANGHIYTCTTAGTTHLTTEPTWPTTEDATVTDNTVTWKLDYDYQYNSDSGHRFWAKSRRLSLVVPNEIRTESDLGHTTTYYGTATDTGSNDLLDIQETIPLRLTSVDEANNIAKGVLEHEQLKDNVGFVEAPMNVGIELYDLVRIYDSYDSISLIGNVLAIKDDYKAGTFTQLLQLGLVSSSLELQPTVFTKSGQNQDSGATLTDLDNLQDVMFENDYILLAKIDSISDRDLATATQINTGTDTLRVVTPDALAGSNLGIRYIQLLCVDFTADVTTGDGKHYCVIPPGLTGLNLVWVHARVITAGTTNTTDIQIANVTDSVDMLSTKITIDSTETGSDTATPAVIDTTKDDVATYDLLRIDVDAVSTTKPKGLILTLGFQLA